jgi:hypothetical protein
MDKQIENLMRSLGCTVEEAKDIVEADKRIDKGEKLFSLTPEQEKASKKARSVAKSPTAYNFTKRERKADEEKRYLIEAIETLLAEQVKADEIEIVNPEREIVFKMNDRKYKIVLSCPRN